MTKKLGRYIKRVFSDILFRFYFPKVYYRAVKNNEQVIANKIVIIKTSLDLTDPFKVICKRLARDYCFETTLFSLKNKPNSFLKAYKYYLNFYKVLAQAKYVFIDKDSRALNHITFRKGTKLIYLVGTCGPYSRQGFLLPGELLDGLDGQENQFHHLLKGGTAFVAASGSFIAQSYIDEKKIDGALSMVNPLGISRVDVYQDYSFRESSRKKIENKIPCSSEKKIILYAPVSKKDQQKYFQQSDIEALKEKLGGKYILLILLRGSIKETKLSECCIDFAFHVNREFSIEVLLSAADIAIFDSLYFAFEYSLLEKPMAFFVNSGRKIEEGLLPGPILNEDISVADYVMNSEKYFDTSKTRYFKERFMDSCDGYATDRIFEKVFANDSQKYKKPTVPEVFLKEDPHGKDISIIIPVYNGLPEISRTLNSVLYQTYDKERMEIIVVDDCSTDGTWKFLSNYKKRYPDFFTIEQLKENSGYGAKPRNKALDLAKGRYIFNVDADDWLASESVERMMKHAAEWGSDIVYAKVCGVNGRECAPSLFTHNQAKVEDIYASKIFNTLGPWKLYRRELLERYSIRFHEIARPEDAPFVIEAACRANIVSVASDYYYYFFSRREDISQHLSVQTYDNLDLALLSFEVTFDFIQANVSHEDRNKTLLRRLFRNLEKMFISLIENYEGKARISYYKKIQNLFKYYYEPDVYETLRADVRVITDVGMFGDLELLEHVVEQGVSCVLGENELKASAGEIILHLKASEKEVFINLAPNLKFNYFIEFVNLSEATFSFNGILRPDLPLDYDLSEIAVELVLVDQTNDRAYETPCVTALFSEPSPGITWSASFNFLTFVESVDTSLDGSWFLYLRFTWNDYQKDMRIGKSSSRNAASKYLSINQIFNNTQCYTYKTRHGNFCLKTTRVENE